MPGSVTSVFSEPGDFEAALREEGGLGLLITGRGQFRARLRAPPNVRDIEGETLG